MTFAEDAPTNVNFSDGDAESQPNFALESRWYAVQVASGCEKRVKASLEQRIQTLDVANRILQIEITQPAYLGQRSIEGL